MMRNSQDQRPLPPDAGRRSFIAVAGAAALVTAGCGGGDLVSLIPGVGTGGTGIVAGTITGLGSVYVDGVRYDDSAAVLERRSDLTRTELIGLSDLHLGQSVYLELDTRGEPARVLLHSHLVGPAANLSPAADRFTVWGQRVLLNRDPAAGPVTVLSGFGDLGELAPLDPVQVYGVLQRDPADASRDLLRATRIERLAGDLPPARITGTLRAAGAGWLLAGVALDTGQVAAVGSPVGLAAGLAVTAVMPWPPAAAGLPAAWRASAIEALGTPRFGAGTLRLSGAANLLPDGRMSVQGVPVDVSDPAIAPMRAALVEGMYVTCSGRLDPATGDLSAGVLEPWPGSGRAMELRGSVSALLRPGLFVVRDQRVDASGAVWIGGTAADLTAGRYVEVSGQGVGNLLRAERITLSPTVPEQAVLEVTGSVLRVDGMGGTVGVRTADGATVVLTMSPMMSMPAPGDVVTVRGFWRDGALQVRETRRPGA